MASDPNGNLPSDLAGADRPEVIMPRYGRGAWTFTRRKLVNAIAIASAAALSGCGGGGKSSGGGGGGGGGCGTKYSDGLGENRADPDTIVSLGISSDATKLFALCSDSKLKYWSLSGGTLGGSVSVSATMTQPPYSRWYGYGKLLAVTSAAVYIIGADYTIEARSQTDGSLIATLTGHTGQVTGLATCDTTNVLVSSSTDGTLKVWSTMTNTLITTLTSPTGEPQTVAISPNGGAIASLDSGTSGGLTLNVWDLATTTVVWHIPWTSYALDAGFLTFSADSTVLAACFMASAGNENYFGLWGWTVASGASLWSSASTIVAATEAKLTAMASDANGTLIAVASADASSAGELRVFLFSISTGASMGTVVLGAGTARVKNVTALAIGSTGQVYAATGDERNNGITIMGSTLSEILGGSLTFVDTTCGNCHCVADVTDCSCVYVETVPCD